MRKKGYTKIIIISLFVFCFLSGILLMFGQSTVVNTKERYRYMASNQANIMKNNIDTAIARVYTFSALVRNNKGSTQFFDTEAETIYYEIVTDSGIPIKNVALAPNGVVEKVFPMEENEKLIGFDFLDKEKAGNEEAIEAYLKGKIVVTNPFKLVQGDMGMAARLPVFIENENQKEFWGLVTVTMDYQKMIEAFSLGNFEEQGICYRLWYEDEDKNQVDLSKSAKLPQNAITYNFKIQNLEWNLDVAPVDGWLGLNRLFISVFSVIIITAAVVYVMNSHLKVQEINEKLRILAHMDALTSCCSRQYINSILINQSNGSWNNPDLDYSLAMIDVDHFKEVNDQYGHEVGDRALIAVAQILKANACETNADCVIRYGGDEFIILWNHITNKHFEEKLKKIMQSISNIKFPDYPDLAISISVGGEVYNPEKPLTFYEMIKKADQKLYKAKNSGRNKYVMGNFPEK